MWKIVYVISGEITATLNSSVYRLSGESMMLVSPEDFYYVKSNKHSDYKEIKFKLKDAKWHDGTPLTSYDVKFTVDLISKSIDSPYYALVENISSNDCSVCISFFTLDSLPISTFTVPLFSSFLATTSFPA